MQRYTSLLLYVSFEHRLFSELNFTTHSIKLFIFQLKRLAIGFFAQPLKIGRGATFTRHIHFGRRDIPHKLSTSLKLSLTVPWAINIPCNSWRRSNAYICVPRKQKLVIKFVPAAGRWCLFDSNRPESIGSEHIFFLYFLFCFVFLLYLIN